VSETQQPISAGTYVRFEQTPDMWQVVDVVGGTALIAPSAITLAGRPRQRVKIMDLRVYQGQAVGRPPAARVAATDPDAPF
jgi:hypothetical protein